MPFNFLENSSISLIKQYKSEIFILGIFSILAIPGIITFLWFSTINKDELLEDFVHRSNLTHQTVVSLFDYDIDFLNQNSKILLHSKDLSNIFVFHNDTSIYSLNVNNPSKKNFLDSLMYLGLRLDATEFVKHSKLEKNGSVYQIYSTFALNPLNNKINSYFNKLLLRAGFIFFIFIILFAFTSMALLQPIRKLLQDIKIITNVDSLHKIDETFPFSEINEIARNINNLVEKVAEKEKKVVEEVQSLIDYLTSRTEELEFAKLNAEKANKYKTEFLANVSHEIRTPLNAILGFTDQLMQSETDETKLYFLNVIKNSGKTLIALVNDILDISKIESGRFEIVKTPVEFHTLLREVRELYLNQAKSKGLELTLDTDQNIPRVLLIDDLRVRQILINLLSNAIKFTNRGSVRITSHLLKLNSKLGTVDISFSVKDTGIGISNEYRKQLFEPFTQQQGQSFRKYGGTGLGLPIVKKLLEMMGGKIELFSQEGIGSEFVVKLFNVEAVLEDDSTTYSQDLALNFNEKKNIVLINQNVTESELLHKLMKNSKLQVYQVQQVNEIHKFIQASTVDLIIYCCIGNQNDNIEFINKLVEINPDNKIPAIGISNSIQEIAAKDPGYFNHFDAVIHKPIKLQFLFNTIAKLLNTQIEPKESGELDEFWSLWNSFLRDCNPVILQQMRENCAVKAREFANKLVLSQIKEFAEDFSKFANNSNDKNLILIKDTLNENIKKFNLNFVKKILKNIGNV